MLAVVLPGRAYDVTRPLLAAAGLGCELVELDGPDHGLAGPGAVGPSAATLTRVADAVDGFVGGLR